MHTRGQWKDRGMESAMSSEEDYDQGINRLPPGDSSRSSKYDNNHVE